MRNVVEHSSSPEILYCAQLWPRRDLAEIAIIDSGIGLELSLRQNPLLTVTSPIQALNLAMTPGITRNPPASRSGSYDPWQNRGLGLYMTSRICQEGGSFTLFSGSAGLVKTPQVTKWFESAFTGTGVRLVIRPSRLEMLQNSMARLRQEGAELARGIDLAGLGDSPSIMLRRLRAHRA